MVENQWVAKITGTNDPFSKKIVERADLIAKQKIPKRAGNKSRSKSGDLSGGSYARDIMAGKKPIELKNDPLKSKLEGVLGGGYDPLRVKVEDITSSELLLFGEVFHCNKMAMNYLNRKHKISAHLNGAVIYFEYNWMRQIISYDISVVDALRFTIVNPHTYRLFENWVDRKIMEAYTPTNEVKSYVSTVNFAKKCKRFFRPTAIGDMILQEYYTILRHEIGIIKGKQGNNMHQAHK